MTTAPKPAREHSYRLSVYQRRANDFYPTPSELAIGLALGLSRLGLDLPRIALDPCGGNGALRRSLASLGIDVRLSDLYPEKYAAADGYVTSQPLDASDPEHLQYAFEQAGPDCTVIITNTPHNTDEACAIVRNLISIVEGQQHVEFVAALFRSIWGAEPGRCPFSTGRHSTAKSFAVGALDGSRELRKAQCMLTRGTSGGRSHGAARL
jgi:hypothetical protein